MFEAAPEVRVISGNVVGLQGMLRICISLDTGKLIELRAGAGLGYAPMADIGRSDAQLDLYSRNYLRRWIFIDSCTTKAY